MSGETIIIGCILMFGIYGIYKGTRSEETAQAKMLEVVKDIRSDITGLSKRIKQIEMDQASVNANFNNYRRIVEEMSGEIDEAQNHLSQVRKTSQYLEKQTYPQKLSLELKPSGPIPIEIYTREPNKKRVTRKVLTKTKTGFRSRVETRESKLKGDPNKYSWPKSKQEPQNKIGRAHV